MITQERMFYAAHRQISDGNIAFMDLVKDGLTRENLASCIKRRPSLWGRFEGFLKTLPSKDDPVKPARLAFISSYRGRLHFRVESGPMQGERVMVRHMNCDFYLEDWQGGSIWNYTEEQYRLEIVEGAGIVNAMTGPVTADVLMAVNLDPDLRGEEFRFYPGPFETAKWTETGWVRVPATMPNTMPNTKT